jgi:hypothetical protein
VRGGALWARPRVDTVGAPDRSYGFPFALSGVAFALAFEPGHRRRAAAPCHIAFAPSRLAMPRTAAPRRQRGTRVPVYGVTAAAEGIAAWRDHGRSIAGAGAPS